MGAILSRSVVIQISNKTRNITLRNPRIYMDCGHCSISPMPELSPDSSDTCNFPNRFPFWVVAGILAYEAESFTLAIHFSNSFDYNKFSLELGLELSPGKAHLGSLEDTYTRMAKGAYSSSDPDIKFSRVIVGKKQGTVQVSDGHVKVTATMSDATDSLLKVVLKGRGDRGRKPGQRTPVERDTTRRSENPQELLWDLVDSPGTAWRA